MQECPLNFMQQISTGHKTAILKSYAPDGKVPNLPEFKVSNIIKEALVHPEFRNYIPDEWVVKPENAERPFFYNILKMLVLEFVHDCVMESRQIRNDRIAERRAEQQPQVVRMLP